MRAQRLAAVLLLSACATGTRQEQGPGPHAAAQQAAPRGDDAERAGRLVAALTEPAPAPVALRQRAPSFGAAKGDIREVYRKVAPATVLVRAGGGFGTGSIVDARGYVLTNHHVIAHAEQVDFKLSVEVERGKLSAAGVMEPEGKPLKAWVLKSDPLADLAILRLEDPPADLKALKISARDPVPGEPVSAIGNGGIGLLWAIKDGEISGVGKLSTHLAMLVGAECHVAETPAAAEQCRQASASMAVEKKLLEEQVPGLVIQSSCPISPGDSGGPLVNRAGELVGVNAFLRSDSRAPVTSNFHVHVQQVRSFLKEVPTEPLARAPSPWELAGLGGGWIDADGDGKDELLVLGVPGSATAIADLLQRPHAPYSAYGRARLDADFALGRLKGRAVAWYDVDGDGVFDRLVLQGEPDQPAKAWRLQPVNGAASIGQFLGAADLVDPTAFADAERRGRLQAIAPQLAAVTGVGLDAAAALTPPDPFAGLLPGARALDTDRDGRVDTITAALAVGSVVYIDPAQTGFGSLDGTTAAARLKQRAARPSVAIVQRGPRRWYFVGSDGHFTLLLLSVENTPELVAGAWALGARGEPGEEQPLWFGRDALHAVTGFFTGAEQARLRTALGATVVWRPRPAPPPGGFPHPVLDVGVDVRVEESGVADYQAAAVSVVGARSEASSLVFELDKAALKGLAEVDREAAVLKGAQGTDFAWTSRGGVEWYQYDTDHDGAFDVVLVRSGERTVARRIVDGVVSNAPELAKGALVRPSLFPDAERAAALRALGPVFFGAAVVER